MSLNMLLDDSRAILSTFFLKLAVSFGRAAEMVVDLQIFSLQLGSSLVEFKDSELINWLLMSFFDQIQAKIPSRSKLMINSDLPLNL